MKQIATIAIVALVGFGFAGCKKDKNDGPVGEATLVVKLYETNVAVRGIEDPATTGPLALNLSTSEIFIIDANGNVDDHVQLTADATTNSGQVIGQVTLDSKIYVVANIPSSDYTRISQMSRLENIKAATSLIALQQGVVPVAANQNGQEASIMADVDDPTRATAELSLVPVISRLEIGAIQGGNDSEGEITGFTVEGIYIDRFFDKFTYSGGGEDEVIFENVADLTTWALKDEDSWPSDGDNIARPDDDQVWAYNVAAGGLPLIIVKLSDITWIPTGGVEQDRPGTYYLTVTGYRSTTVFAPGQVYRVGLVNQTTGDSDFTFGPENLGITPNETPLDLTLTVHNIGWTLVDDGVIIGN